MEQHRDNPVCASCHARMDPLGFALENFDAIGRWRDADTGLPIDAVSSMPGGATIDGAAGFHEFMLSRSDQFVRTLTKKLLEYGVGRTLEYYDEPSVRRILRDASRSNYQWSSLYPRRHRERAISDAAGGDAGRDEDRAARGTSVTWERGGYLGTQPPSPFRRFGEPRRSSRAGEASGGGGGRRARGDFFHANTLRSLRSLRSNVTAASGR